MAKAYFGCPGNGGQHHIYYEKNLIATRENQPLLAKINEVAGHDLVGMMLDKEGRLGITKEPDIQLSIVGSGIILGRAMQKKVVCEGTVGLSLGEITAGALAGCFDYETAFRIAKHRGEIMEACVPDLNACSADQGMPNAWMYAVNNVPLRFVERRCGHVNRRSEAYGYVCVSGKNTPLQVVISGLPSAVAKAVHGINRKYPQGKILPLRTSGPWHNKHYMAKAKEEMISFLDSIPFKSPSVLFYMMASRRFEKDPAKIKYNYGDAMVRTTETWESLCDIRKEGFAVFSSTGPGKVLEPFFNSVGIKYIGRSEILEEKVAETVLSK